MDENPQDQRMQQLAELIGKGQTAKGIQEDPGWQLWRDMLNEEITLLTGKILSKSTTAEEYIDLRAQVNANVKMLSKLDVLVALGKEASRQMKDIEKPEKLK